MALETGRLAADRASPDIIADRASALGNAPGKDPLVGLPAMGASPRKLRSGHLPNIEKADRVASRMDQNVNRSADHVGVENRFHRDERREMIMMPTSRVISAKGSGHSQRDIDIASPSAKRGFTSRSGIQKVQDTLKGARGKSISSPPFPGIRVPMTVSMPSSREAKRPGLSTRMKLHGAGKVDQGKDGLSLYAAGGTGIMSCPISVSASDGASAKLK